MRTIVLWLALIVAGLTLGIGSAVLSLRSAGFGDDVRIGPWTTGRAIGTADADIRTRAVVALRGLLALPASEARYFTARVDGAGQPLRGECYYEVSGGFWPREDGQNHPARWLSLTVYDREGWLIPNSLNRHSLGSWFMDGPHGYMIYIGPTDEIRDPDGGINPLWIPTGTDGPFELTLRAYRPTREISEAEFLRSLPTISQGYCPP